MKCTNCGGDLPNEAMHCPNCGAACPAAAQQQPQMTVTVDKKMSWWKKIWSQPRMARKDYWILGPIMGILASISMPTLILPIFFVICDIVMGAHRLHDANHSAWHLLWLLLPFIGPVIVLILCLGAGTPGTNKYGDTPQRIF